METKPAPHITKFSDYLKPNQVVFDLKSKDKVEAIEELLDVLAKQKLIDNKKLLLTRIIDRENLVSTAIGSGVALPHARVDAGGEIAVAVGRSDKGIDFDAHDGQKVHLIILVVWNPTLPGLFNHLFAGLARFLIRAENRGRIQAAKDKAELYDILSGIEFKFVHEEKIVSRARLLKKLQEIELRKKRGDQGPAEGAPEAGGHDPGGARPRPRLPVRPADGALRLRRRRRHRRGLPGLQHQHLDPDVLGHGRLQRHLRLRELRQVPGLGQEEEEVRSPPRLASALQDNPASSTPWRPGSRESSACRPDRSGPRGPTG
ncbi:MAG: PTS sugar transporter subunit IIA [Marinilabiliales bacterium]|nr:PTS sugar transporter subunit IIA [Marinilabiliales bacterium]